MSKRNSIVLILLMIPLGAGIGFLWGWLVPDKNHGKIDYKKNKAAVVEFPVLGKDIKIHNGTFYQHVDKKSAPHHVCSDRLRFKILGDADVVFEVRAKEDVLLAIDNGDVLVSNGKDSMVLHGHQSMRATMDKLEFLNCRYTVKDSMITCLPDITKN